MTRVPYLAALAGSTERRPAPLLRPPRRLFPHELPPVEPLPEPQPAGETGGKPTTTERSAVAPQLAVPEAVGEEPVEVVAPVRARRSDIPSPPPNAAGVREIVRPNVENTPTTPRRETEDAPEPRAPVTAIRPQDPLLPARLPARREERAEPKPALRDPAEPTHAPAARRSEATLEPSRIRARTTTPPERAATRPRGLQIGSIEVTVTPPAAAPHEPAFTAPPTPAPRPPATFDPRGASMSRWFGLAQR